MNVIVVPFFLAANLMVNDMSNWKFGPEYSYNMSIIFDMKETLNGETYGIVNLNTTVQCRPKDTEILFCRLNNISRSAEILDRKIKSDIASEKTFGIKFNEHGVEALLVESPGDIRILNVIRQIANQFSMNVNLIQKNNVRPMLQFMDRENTSMGNCMTTYMIMKHGKYQPNLIQKKDTNFEFRLPTTNVKLGTILSISKNRKDCADGPEESDVMTDSILKVERFNSTIWIGDTYKISTEINGYLKLMKKPSLLLYKETIELNLDTIKPAQDELPSTFNDQMIDLNTKVMPNQITK